MLLALVLTLGMLPTALAADGVPNASGLLTEPFLQAPGETSVNVVWFTEGETAPGVNQVLLYENGADQPATRVIAAETTALSRVRGGKTASTCNDPTVERTIWRHEAVVTGLPEYHGNADEQVPYSVVSDDARSQIYTLQAQAQAGTPMKILLTSDIQTKNMCAANIQKVFETVGPVDAVLANGDIVDVADRAYDWFDADSSFFRVMQGTSDRMIGGETYTGAPLIQNAPLYASIGNHEVMGRYSETASLSTQFNDPTTRAYAEDLYERVNSDEDPTNDVSEADKEQFLLDNSFNTTTWEEVLSLPESDTGDERYYAVSIGDVRVIVLEVARIWRANTVGSKSKYSEVPGASVDDYGFGQHIFEPIGEGSDQLAFLEEELASDEFQNAKYKMVMFHWQFHSLGGNQVPAYTDPVASTVTDPVSGQEMTIYDYPLAQDYLSNYVEPLLEEYGVDFVFNAHSHLWNRFQTDSGMNILETSNNGNTYLLTANEGDASEWGDYTNLTTVEIDGAELEVLDKTKLEGLPAVPSQVNFSLGGRSFSIYEDDEQGLTQIFDSGSDFETVTAAAYPAYFNASNKNNKLDSRSDAKGPEPESVTVAQTGGRTYAYIGLERIGGVMLYDVTDPENPFFCDYINSRNFTVDFPSKGTDPAQGDVSVEGLCVVPAIESPTGYPLILAANEVSGTVAVYQQNQGYQRVHGDVTLTLSGETETTLDAEALTYTVSAGNMVDLATATITLEIGGDCLAEPEVRACGGFYVIAQTWENGKLTVVAGSNTGVSSQEALEILTVTLRTTGKTGEARVAVTDAVLSAFDGDDSETFVNAVLDSASVTTKVTYSKYDVNRDGVVDQLDLTRAQRYYGTADAVCDVNGDGEVNVSDLILILNNYSKA